VIFRNANPAYSGNEFETVGYIDEALLGIGLPKRSICDLGETIETVFGRIQAVWR